MAPSYSVYQLHLWFQSHLLTSVKKRSEVCYFLHTSFLNRLTLRNKLDHLIFPVHCKSTLPRKFLPELLAIILAWTQGILEVELKDLNIFLHTPLHVLKVWWLSHNSRTMLLSFMHSPITFRVASIFHSPSDEQSHIFPRFLLAHICYSSAPLTVYVLTQRQLDFSVDNRAMHS